jgi:hypothetical protein
MPLVKAALESGIKGELTPLINTRTNKAMKDALTAMLDTDLLANTDSKTARIQKASDAFAAEMKKLADDIAKVVSLQVDTFVKTATVIVPPGQVVATAGSPAAQVGATTAPSPPALIS